MKFLRKHRENEKKCCAPKIRDEEER